jgi:hypothetical protein
MLVLINGGQGLVQMAKGSTQTLKVVVAKDDGSAEDLTGDSIDLVVYDRSDRANAAIATHVGDTVTTPTAGFVTCAITSAELTYGPGDYFLFARWNDASATKVYYSAPIALSIN